MKATLHNYRSKRGLRGLVPLLPACVLPLALIGFTAKPALEYTNLASRLEQAEQRSRHARQLEAFLAGFDAGRPPTETYRHMEAQLVERIPSSFEATQFFETALLAAHGLDVTFETIVPKNAEDLRLPLAHLSIHEYGVTLKGRGHVDHLTAFLAALHRAGTPVCVHGCKLHAIEDQPGVFDFHLEVGVSYLALPPQPDDEFLLDF